VVNLSASEVSQGEVSLLSKGLKFFPTPKELDRAAIKRDFKDFERWIKYKYHFLLNPSEQDIQSFRQFREKSVWKPNIEDPVVAICLKKLKEKIDQINEMGSNYSNLQISEQRALKSLKNRRDIYCY